MYANERRYCKSLCSRVAVSPKPLIVATSDRDQFLTSAESCSRKAFNILCGVGCDRLRHRSCLPISTALQRQHGQVERATRKRRSREQVHPITFFACRGAYHTSAECDVDVLCVSCSAHGQVTGIHPSDRQGSYIVDAAEQDTQQSNNVSTGQWEKFWLEAHEVQALLKENTLTEDQLLQNLITPASSLARPPISSFHVG